MPARLTIAARFCLLSFAAMACQATVSAASEPTAVIQLRCSRCHEKAEASGGIDLSALTTDVGKSRKLWGRVERMIASRKMPPPGEPPLTAAERVSVLDWYRQTFILRNGKPQVGVSPLRRLTRYELENTLEDVLRVKLKRPYVFSSESAGLRPSTIEQLYPADPLGASGFDNDAERLRQVKIPVLKLMSCVDFALRKFDQDPGAREAVLGFRDKPRELSVDEAAKVLNRFADRAFRGGANDKERAVMLAAYHDAAEDQSAYEAIMDAMKIALLSPSFVYRFEQTRESAEPYRVSGPELAVRLSYFLWSTMPDDALMAAGRSGALLESDVLLGQLRRMLNDPKRVALSENFAGQWLGFSELRRDPVYYAGESWTRGVYDELLFSFDELIRSDRSILEIVDADWAFLRPDEARRMKAKGLRSEAKYDDIFAARRSRAGLKVERFYLPPQMYQLDDDAQQRWGGLLTSAGIMRLTSAPARTNPIRRGVWLLENIVGEAMEPPANIPPLAEAEKKVASSSGSPGSRAEILEAHTARESCRACHKHIDPIGLGLENYSPRGEWRERYPNQAKIESAGKLPNGREFHSPKALKRELLACYHEQIVDNAIRRMLSYALGRQLEPWDRIALEKIHEALRRSDYRMGTLIEQVVLSEPFLCRQDLP